MAESFEKIKIEPSKIVYYLFPNFGIIQLYVRNASILQKMTNNLVHFHYVSHFHSLGQFSSGHFILGHILRESFALDVSDLAHAQYEHEVPSRHSLFSLHTDIRKATARVYIHTVKNASKHTVVSLYL